METKEVIKTLRKFKTESDQIEAKDASRGFSKKCYDTILSFSNKNCGISIFFYKSGLKWTMSPD